MDTSKLGLSTEISILMLLSRYGLKDTEENRNKVVKNSVIEFANTYTYDCPVLKY
jgi:hypothetical protein